MLKALVVDDEFELANGLAGWLKEVGIESQTALSGREAKDKLQANSVDLVISDIRMPEMTGIDLLQWLGNEKKETRVILVTGYADYDAQEMLSLGCSGFLTKPITKAELIESVKAISSDFSADQSTGMKFAKIRLDSFLMGRKCPFSLYLKMNDGRFVKMANKNAELDAERIQKFKKSNIQELWVESCEFPVYLQMCRQLSKVSQPAAATASTENTKTTHARGQELVKNMLEVSYEGLRVMGVNETSLKSAVEDLRRTMTPCLAKKIWVDQLDQYKMSSASLYTSSAMSTNLMAAVVKLMGWQSTKNIDALLLGAFFRDIALTEKEGLAFKPIEQMTPAESEFYLSHPTRGAEILRKLPDISQQSILIVEQHHENTKGDGFPARLSGVKIFPMAKMVSTLDQVMMRLISADGKPVTEPEQIKKRLERLEGHVADHPTYMALVSLLTNPTFEKAKEYFSQNAYSIGVKRKRD